MADAVTTIAAPAASAGAVAAALTGAPPDMVVLGAVIGAVLSLWSRTGAPVEVSTRWVLGALAHFGTAVTVGYVGSSMLASILPGYQLLAPLAQAPQWAWSVALAGSMEFTLPLVRKFVSTKADTEAAR